MHFIIAYYLVLIGLEPPREGSVNNNFSVKHKVCYEHFAFCFLLLVCTVMMELITNLNKCIIRQSF